MPKVQKQKLINEIKAILLSKGFEADRYGNYVKGQRRYKFADNVLRAESRIAYGDGSKSWIRIRSGYYSKLSITEDGKIAGLGR